MKIDDRFRKGIWPSVFSMVLVAVASRLMPHLPNFTPVGAMAIFAGAVFPKNYALLFAIAAQLLSDAVMGFYAMPLMLFVYIATMANVLTGFWLSPRKRTIATIAAASIAGATAFFVLSNFGYWLSGLAYYPMTSRGLLECYIAAFPFYGITLVSNLLFSGLLFGTHRIIGANSTSLRAAS